MATRMQQRRGTAAQWTAANPILAAGEIGFETDTSKFKMGNGSSAWSALTYFANAAELSAIIDAAPEALNTLNELAAAIGDDPAFFTNIAESISDNIDSHNALTNVHGIANTALLATLTNVATAKTEAQSFATTAVSTHQADQTDVHGIADTAALATKQYADAAVSTHSADNTDVHGIANTTLLATLTNVATAKTEAQSFATTAVSTHQADTTSVHGIADTSLLATQDFVQTSIGNSSVDQSLLAGVGIDWNAATYQYDIDSTVAAKTYVANEISTHNSDTTNVHGIADTSALALTATVNSGLALKANLAGPTFTGTVSGITKSMVGLGNVDNTLDSAKPVSTAQQTALDSKANLASPTFTGTVSGITKTMVGLGSVDNTADADKPVSTAATTALALKAPLASPALTGVPTAPTAAAATNTTQVATTAYVRGEVAALVNSAGATLDTLGEIATALGNDANLSTTLTNAISLKAPLASPTFTGTVSGITKSMVGLGSVDNTADTAKPVSTAQQTALDSKANLASPTFTGTVTAPAITATALITASASGVAFTDGTQTKEGVPSRTPIIQKTAAYTLSALSERDSLIEVSSATGVTITIPTNIAVAYPIGTSIDILQTGAGQVTIAPVDGTVTVNATPGLKLRTTWSSATLFKRAANTWVVFGDLTA